MKCYVGRCITPLLHIQFAVITSITYQRRFDLSCTVERSKQAHCTETSTSTESAIVTIESAHRQSAKSESRKGREREKKKRVRHIPPRKEQFDLICKSKTF